jgi:hypothetical protein
MRMRRLVRLGAGAQQQAALQVAGRVPRDLRGQRHHRARQHAAEEVVERAHLLETTATMSGCEWPSSALIWPEVKSRMPRPSASYTKQPCARSMISGSKVPP